MKEKGLCCCAPCIKYFSNCILNKHTFSIYIYFSNVRLLFLLVCRWLFALLGMYRHQPAFQSAKKFWGEKPSQFKKVTHWVNWVILDKTVLKKSFANLNSHMLFALIIVSTCQEKLNKAKYDKHVSVKSPWRRKRRRLSRRARCQPQQIRRMTVWCPAASVEDQAEAAFHHFYSNVPAGPPLSQVLRDPEKRRRLGE